MYSANLIFPSHLGNVKITDDSQMLVGCPGGMLKIRINRQIIPNTRGLFFTKWSSLINAVGGIINFSQGYSD